MNKLVRIMSISQPPTLRRASLADLVYERLTAQILGGELASGANINLSDISRDLGVSSIPVREAVVRLGCEGLVCCETNRRATVEEFTRDCVIENFQLREFLETGAACLTAERIGDEELSELRELDASISAISGQVETAAELFALEDQFHRKLVTGSGNQLLLREYTLCQNRITAIRSNWLRDADVSKSLPLPDHGAILGGLESHCPETTSQAVADHIREALAQMILTLT
uniref:GntR family transcriptional regulator n=1 Tax=uncultured planctomycete 3FN TaxID=455066 RepID=A9LGW6_9BACT|nr:GntR family transcriptional regulator [uncultured planctomycete 3FN]